tara:strand:- start:3179 stop:4687 length:1509 start_codon:yes stop_codon:yes gene_type:complete
MTYNVFYYRFVPAIISIIAGAFFSLGFAPLEYFSVAPLSVAVLFFLWVSATPKASFFLGLLFGIGAFTTGVSWVFVSLHSYGNMPASLAVLIVFLFIFIMALYPAICGLLQGMFKHLGLSVRMLLICPALWVLFEWLRSQMFGGFPWLLLGYTQVDTMIGSWAPIAGAFSVSFMAAMFGSAIILIFVGALKTRLVSVFAMTLIILLSVFCRQQVFVFSDGEPISVAIIQNNVSLSEKWNPAEIQNIAKDYLTASSVETNADLIVWPESSLPIYLDQLSTIFIRQLVEHPADYIFGVLEKKVEPELKYFNSAVGISRDIDIYRKRQLVMFGEYLPMPFLFSWILDNLDMPMSSFTSWKQPQSPMKLAGNQIGVTICYEDAFQARVLSMLPESTVLVNISEDAWFGDSFAPWQRLQIAQIRALEVGRPLIRSSNNGLSAVIGHNGKIQELAGMFESEVVRGSVQPMSGLTPFVKYGNRPMFLFLGVLFSYCLAVLWLKRKDIGH